MRYLRRIVDDELDELLSALPAVSLEGANGVGNTETALQRAVTVYRLDDPAVQAIAGADPTAMLDRPTPILLDEWQRTPPTWDAVRRAVDDGASPNSYLLTGSASSARPPTHSGAARVVTVRMRPLSLHERQGADASTVSLREILGGGQPRVAGNTDWGLGDYVAEIVRSGFPGIRHLSGRALHAQLAGYLARRSPCGCSDSASTRCFRDKNPVLRFHTMVHCSATSSNPSSPGRCVSLRRPRRHRSDTCGRPEVLRKST